MKKCLMLMFLLNALSITYSVFLREKLESVGKESDFHDNAIAPGRESIMTLKQIIVELIDKLENINEDKQGRESSSNKVKNLEVKMPEKGKELKIKHGLNINDIMNISVNIVNGRDEGMIIRSQVDLISHKVLFNWYVDHENFVLIRANNLSTKDSLFLDNARVRIVLFLK